MTRRMSITAAGAALAFATLVLTGGCPLGVDSGANAVLGISATLPAPGTYFVEMKADGLSYFQMARVRGEADAWMPLADDGMWFDGPGFYRLDENAAWSRDPNFDGLTLDDVLQLNDAPPAAPIAEPTNDDALQLFDPARPVDPADQ